MWQEFSYLVTAFGCSSNHVKQKMLYTSSSKLSARPVKLPSQYDPTAEDAKQGVALAFDLCVLYHRTLQRHHTENSKQIFPGKELRGNSPNSYIYVSVSNLYIPLIGLPILLQENRWAERTW